MIAEGQRGKVRETRTEGRRGNRRERGKGEDVGGERR